MKKQEHFDNIVKYNYLSYFKESYEDILEIGCSVGYTLNSIKRLNKFKNIEGVDISDPAVKMAKKYTGIKSIHCIDVFDFLTINNLKYDVIIMKAVLEHIPKEKTGTILALIYNALKPNGLALISVPNMGWVSATYERYMNIEHETGFTIESLRDVVSAIFDQVMVKTLKNDFIHGPASYIRIKLLQPLIKLFIRIILITLGQGANRKTMFDRGLLSICYKK